jgi:hypothetical protein
MPGSQKLQSFGGPAVITENSFRSVALRRRFSPVLPLSSNVDHYEFIFKSRFLLLFPPT